MVPATCITFGWCFPGTHNYYSSTKYIAERSSTVTYVMASVLRVNTIGHVRSMLARAHVPLHFNVWVECFVLPVKDEGDVLFVKVGTI